MALVDCISVADGCILSYHVSLGHPVQKAIYSNCCVLINPHEILMASAVGHGPHARRAGPGRAWLSAGLVPEWVALAAKRRPPLPEAPKAPRSATPASTAPPSADIGALRFTGTVLAGRRCAAWAIYAQRAPNWTPSRARCHRVLGKPCCILPDTKGPLFPAAVQPRWPKSENPHFPLQSSPQNRIFRAEVHPATPPSGPWWFGVLSGISPAHVGPRGTRIRPRGGPSGQKSKKYTFHTNRAPKSHYLSRSTHQRPPSPAPGAPGPSGMITNPI